MKKKFDVTSIGSATVDLFFSGNTFTVKQKRLSLAFGGKYRAKDFTQTFGGGGMNTSVGFSRLGLKTSYTGEISKDWLGKEIIDNLQKEKVDTEYLSLSNVKQSVSTILLSPSGERTIISYIAPNYNKPLTSSVRTSIKLSKWLFFCDHKSSKNYKIEVLKYAQRNKTKIAISLGAEEFKKGFIHNEEYLRLSDIFFLNAHELADLVKRKYDNLELLSTNYAQILKTKLLLVTDAKKGEYAYNKERITFRKAAPQPAKTLDTTGAGDAFAVGFLYSHIKCKTIEESADFGSKNAVSVIQKIGAQTGLLYA